MGRVKYTSLSWLRKNERASIDETLAIMTYNPSIGRVLASGGVVKFKKAVVRKIRQLKSVKNQKDFDEFHRGFVRDVMKNIKLTSVGKRLSYGQGQKPVNVFLKVYVDWAGYPDRQVSSRLKGFLHLPLDSYVMWYIKDERRKDFDEIVKPIYKKKKLRISNLSLSDIDEEIYYAWQELCRRICPKRPILLDVIWAKVPR